MMAALRVGASGYLLKGLDAYELVRHLDNVYAGEIVIDPTLTGRVAASAAHLQSGEFWPGARLGLTQRESEVLALLVGGLSNKANRLVALQGKVVRDDLMVITNEDVRITRVFDETPPGSAQIASENLACR